jgi:flagellar biogenesis protein FliO
VVRQQALMAQFGTAAATIDQPSVMERTMEVYQILFLLWVIVFAMWLVKQFNEYNKRTDK